MEKPRMAQAPNQRRVLMEMGAQANTFMGRLDEALHSLEEIGSEDRFATGVVHIMKGDFDRAESLLREIYERSAKTAPWMAFGHVFWLGRIAWYREDFSQAEELTKRFLEGSIEAQALPPEVNTRVALSGIYSDWGKLELAHEHLAKAREGMANGEDWRASVGYAELSEAMLATAEERFGEADSHFGKALDNFGQYQLPFMTAETLHRWGDMLFSTGDVSRSLEKLDAALELYRRHGAGTIWVQKVVASKLRAQGVDTTATMASIDAVAAAVEAEAPDLTPHVAPDGTVTILFSDIEGSTEMNDRLGDHRWFETVRAHNAIVREQVRRHSGHEVKSLGDGFMVAFSSARRALDCALGIQRGLSELNESRPDEPLRVRIGLHTGEALREGGDFFGKDVTLAARIAGTASGGEVLVSLLTRDLVAGGGEFSFDQPRAIELKGFAEKQLVTAVSAL
jgi:class 3 adenylate cyclase